jgi:hypothetical protein
MPGDDASPAAGTRFQRLDRRHDMDRVSKEDRTVEFPFQDGQERERVDSRRLASHRPVAMAKPNSPWATGRPKGLPTCEE